jgi:hypothetical protein
MLSLVLVDADGFDLNMFLRVDWQLPQLAKPLQ